LPAETVPASPRRRYIDWLRGIAVLVMIEAHTLDAWTRPASRHGLLFRDLTILGGFAAPAFLWLAGLALVLSAERVLRRTGSRRRAAEAIVRRGLEIFVLAFLFRIQAFVVSPGGWSITIFRVDILNVMGPSIAAAGIIWGLAGDARWSAVLTGLCATLIAMLTPIIRTALWIDAFPLWIQWYLRPFGDHTTFTLLPWSGFVFAGAACGAVLALDGTGARDKALLTWLAAAGGLFVAAGFYTSTLPPLYASTFFWTTSPTFFAIRAGILLVALGLAYWWSSIGSLTSRARTVVETFGRNSLFVYWLHVEIVYGYATWIIHGRLPVWGTASAYAVFCALMYVAVLAKQRIVERWRSRRSGRVGDRLSEVATA
jgi:uncharacterized membrane protein